MTDENTDSPPGLPPPAAGASRDEPLALYQMPFAHPADAGPLLGGLGRLLEGARLKPGMRVLDFGAGSCWLSKILVELGCTVTSCDSSAEALAVGRRLFEQFPPIDAPGGFPRFLPHDGAHLDIASRSQDRIIVNDAFCQMADPAAMLREFHRVLRPGGLVALSASDPARTFAALWDAARAAGFERIEVVPALDPPVLDIGEYLEVVAGRLPQRLPEEIRHGCPGHAVCILRKSADLTQDDFDERFYLRTNGDVAAAVAAGHFKSGWEHFEHHGRATRRSARSLSTGNTWPVAREPNPVAALFERTAPGLGRLRQIAALPEPHVRYIMAITPRSGSSYLCDMMRMTQGMGNPSELMAEDEIRRQMGDAFPGRTPDAYLRNALRATGTANGVAGFKVSWFQFRMFMEAMTSPDDLAGFRFIYLTRGDLAAQAVSLYKAAATSVFHTNVRHGEEALRRVEALEYDHDRIGEWHDHIVAQENGWREYFAERQCSPLHVTYEEVRDDPRDVLRRIAMHLSLAPDLVPPSLSPSASVFRKMGDDKSAEWARRFTAELEAAKA